METTFSGLANDHRPASTPILHRRDEGFSPALSTSDVALEPPVTLSASGLPLQFSGVFPTPAAQSRQRHFYAASKRLLDLLLVAASLIVVGPLLLLIAIAVKVTSSGPVLFSQSRVGKDGVLFRMFKFRTLKLEGCDEIGLAQVTQNDSRITWIGRFLRTTSVDELPQIINIIRGDMSLIGPRPMVPGMQAAGADYHELVPYYDYRHSVKPGLSGWAQANGLRGPTDDPRTARARIEHDCAYVQHMSFGLDVKILLLTIKNEFLTGTGV